MIFETGSTQSNLACFLHCTTPTVRSQFLPKSEIRNLNRLWHPWEREKVEFFTLGDLWNCYDEGSAYGAGVPIVLNNGETLVQYYVPYLSAIQIFTSNSSVNSFKEETESGDGERDSFSDSLSDESESDKLWRWDGCSSEEGGSEQDSLWHVNNRLGYLYFQYFERSTPYGRVPLMDKINGLSRRYPGLMSLRSVDLSPASWMAVSWYPIYHIPMGRTIKDLSTCFLTYHTLSSSFQDMDLEDDIDSAERKRKEGEGISLPPFGLATYKMQGNVWNSGRDQERLVSLLSVADSWLKQLRVQHHDFNYFTGARRG
ncbi:(RS)-norcoclaurine 6-O-methyltransferase-like isoform 1 [Hibiscus syriacus]|uniref:(RS)-norcoclaurine 6-O-methyltransferase-like isoform 1 n=1 Tax=Hibiscus syriacus TaxID=106335 RepID=A0A6A2XZK5_HIBSY|nr:uncharacterized protein LOC120171360 isoform X2 [Hibiscus syriacus]KAE8672925.1 (RS)-norcoclaurine 6-O-methyltransferase-like isoform 1 [Hibiscus syriacus]